MSDARYVVGIDLGTTNTVISYVDTEAEGDAEISVLPVRQLVAPGVVEAKETLPSFLYLAAGPEFAEGALDLPWSKGDQFAVGALARDQGATVPARVVSSAKSWLCHSGIDRSAPLLPWDAPEDVKKISALDASARTIEHLRDAWNEEMAKDDPFCGLENQDVYLTVPASFDAAARELTLTAAKRAGLMSVTLLEEPQAAFYAWLAHMGESWRDKLTVGDIALVCDVGGGTTDFSLIEVKEDKGELLLERIAVGEHILLGGDNMDLALALTVADRLADTHQLDPWQTRALWHACCVAKEQLFVDPALEKAPVTILGRGSKVIGGSIKAELLREDVEAILVDGFFPECDAGDRPITHSKTGLQEIGLPYAADAAVNKHMAKFLAEHLGAERFPTAVLFNGGVMKADSLRGRVSETLERWAGQPLRQLAAANLDLAVSRGATYYGQVRRGRGVRIRGGVGRSYYIGIESAMPAVPGMPAPLKALCVVPFGMEEGTEASIDGKEFGMVVGEAVEFRFLSSTVRKDDAIGTMVERWPAGEIEELLPIQTSMDGEEGQDDGATIPVRLHSHVTEVGTLDLQLRNREGDRSWKLQYYVRDNS